MIEYPFYINSNFYFTGYVQRFNNTPPQKKILISNMTLLLVDYNLTTDVQFEFTIQVDKKNRLQYDQVKDTPLSQKAVIQLNNYYSSAQINVELLFVNHFKKEEHNLYFIFFLVAICVLFVVVMAIIWLTLKKRKGQPKKAAATPTKRQPRTQFQSPQQQIQDSDISNTTPLFSNRIRKVQREKEQIFNEAIKNALLNDNIYYNSIQESPTFIRAAQNETANHLSVFSSPDLTQPIKFGQKQQN